jgi:hypothetical protein
MAIGPGKYDELCTYVMEQAQAYGAVVIVFGGEKGPGFSVQAPLNVCATLPRILRALADDIEKDFP